MGERRTEQQPPHELRRVIPFEQGPTRAEAPDYQGYTDYDFALIALQIFSHPAYSHTLSNKVDEWLTRDGDLPHSFSRRLKLLIDKPLP